MCQCLHLQELHLDVKGKQGRSHRLFIIISKLMDVDRMLIENSINAALRDKKWLQIFMSSSDISYHIVNLLIMTEQLVHVHHEVLWQLIPCHSRGNVNQLSQAFELPLQMTSSSWVTSVSKQNGPLSITSLYIYIYRGTTCILIFSIRSYNCSQLLANYC